MLSMLGDIPYLSVRIASITSSFNTTASPSSLFLCVVKLVMLSLGCNRQLHNSSQYFFELLIKDDVSVSKDPFFLIVYVCLS